MLVRSLVNPFPVWLCVCVCVISAMCVCVCVCVCMHVWYGGGRVCSYLAALWQDCCLYYREASPSNLLSASCFLLCTNELVKK